MNERYGKYTAPTGKTRKSAASVKPKRAAGGAPASGSRPASGGKNTSPARRPAPVSIHPPTPEYKRWRTIWWVFLGAAIVFSTLAWWMWQDAARRAIGNWVLGAGYAMILAAIFIDWTKMRPLRKEWMESGGRLPKADAGEGDAAKAEMTREDDAAKADVTGRNTENAETDADTGSSRP